MRKCLSVLLCLVIVLCSSCGSSADSYKIESPDKDKEISADDNSLTVWCWDQALNISAMQIAEEIYKKEHPEFNLNIVEVPWDDLQTKVINAVKSSTTETLPDIILMQDNAYQKNVSTYPDGFVDLSDSGIDYSKFSSGKVSYSTVDGKNYGVPYDNGAVIAAYRTDILEQAGLTVDDFTDITWSEYLRLGKQVLEKTGYPLLSCVAGSTDVVVMMLQSAGGSFFDENQKPYIVDNEILKEVLKIYTELVKSGVVVEMTDWDGYTTSITESKVAGTVNGCWIMAYLKTNEEQSGKWTVTNMPKLDNVESATNYANQGGSSWAVTTGCKNVELAKDFLASTFGSSMELYERVLDNGAIACYLPMQDSSKYAEKIDFFGGDAVNMKVLDYASKIPTCIAGNYLYAARDATGIAVQNLISGADMDAELVKINNKVISAMGK